MTAHTDEHATEEAAVDDGKYTEPPEDMQRESQRVITLPVTSVQTILHDLRLADEFLRQAGPATQAELHAFGAAQGWSTVCGAGAFIDRIGLHALRLHHAITTDHTGTDQETA